MSLIETRDLDTRPRTRGGIVKYRLRSRTSLTHSDRQTIHQETFYIQIYFNLTFITEGEIMAPPLGSKPGLPSDPPETGSRTIAITKAKALISIAISNFSKRSNLIENVLSEAHGSTSKVDDDTGIEDEIESIISTEEFPLPPKESTIEINSSIASPISHVEDDKKNGIAPLMAAIKGLLDLTNDYLQKLEEKHPGIGVEFLAILRRSLTNNRHQARQDTWAKKAESQDAGIKVFNLKRQILKASAPQG
ncbi:hypothetical protein EPUL_000497 [Erysiphe pulchra]|uniref:Uncharacterized protein n=1 Tax=Erysiphe pulchra TaxID=225359 RepID=A0A2S4Q074_9PEZI|nr:hypothetical protein EPUL_000497 [Erysiphe pulchra]